MCLAPRMYCFCSVPNRKYTLFVPFVTLSVSKVNHPDPSKSSPSWIDYERVSHKMYSPAQCLSTLGKACAISLVQYWSSFFMNSMSQLWAGTYTLRSHFNWFSSIFVSILSLKRKIKFFILFLRVCALYTYSVPHMLPAMLSSMRSVVSSRDGRWAGNRTKSNSELCPPALLCF